MPATIDARHRKRDEQEKRLFVFSFLLHFFDSQPHYLISPNLLSFIFLFVHRFRFIWHVCDSCEPNNLCVH